MVAVQSKSPSVIIMQESSCLALNPEGSYHHCSSSDYYIDLQLLQGLVKYEICILKLSKLDPCNHARKNMPKILINMCLFTIKNVVLSDFAEKQNAAFQ